MALPDFLKRKPTDDAASGSGARRPVGSVDAVEKVRTRTRQRLIGAVVLLTIGVIGFPLLFESQPRPIPVDIPIEIPKPDGAPALSLPAPRADAANASSQTASESTVASGVVTRDAGVPLDRVRVEGSDPITGASSEDFTNAAGAYTLEGLTAGSYRIEASDYQIGEYQFEYYQDTQNSAAATLVPAAKDQAVGGINLALAPVVAEPATGIDITGTVVDETGKPVVGTYVESYSTPADVNRRAALALSSR